MSMGTVGIGLTTGFALDTPRMELGEAQELANEIMAGMERDAPYVMPFPSKGDNVLRWISCAQVAVVTVTTH